MESTYLLNKHIGLYVPCGIVLYADLTLKMHVSNWVCAPRRQTQFPHYRPTYIRANNNLCKFLRIGPVIYNLHEIWNLLK